MRKISFYLMIVVCFSAVFSGKAVAQDQGSIKELFQSAQKAYEERRYQDAINDFEAIIEKNNGFAAAYHALGLIYQETSSDPRYPLWYFETAVEIDPNFAPSYDVLCRSYYQLQEYYEAERVCHRALDLNPNLLSSQLSLAWVYLIGYSDAGQAIYYFEKAVKRLKSPVVYFGLGMAYAMENEHGKVLDIVTHLREEGAEDFATHLEGILRSKRVAELAPQGFLKKEESSFHQEQLQAAPVQQQQPSQIRTVAVPVPVPVIVKPKITGSPQIRIKGKIRPPTITGGTGKVERRVRGGQSGKHPGGLSGD